MKKVKGFSPNNLHIARELVQIAFQSNTRECPSCGKVTLTGMPGGRDAVCGNCGFKDPCCYD